MSDKLDMKSPDLVNANFEKLAALFPNCVTEGSDGKAIDFDLLKQELSHSVVEGIKERYRLEWPGKREAIVTANLPTNKTLRPVREASVDFDNTENIYIEGDNLEVLKLLQESYLGKIKMIYIDPPYNTGKDFVYKDNFARGAQEELLVSGQKDEYNQRLVVNPETSGRYHSDWLSMMYPRLKLARNLLKDDGVIFISIDDNEVHNLRKVCDEVYGEKNFVSDLVWEKKKKGTFLSNTITNVKEYILVYAKDITLFKGLIGEVNSEEATYPCINASNKREIRRIPPGISSKYRELNYTLKKGSVISVTTMDLILHSDLVIKEGKLEKELIIEGNWRYSQESMFEYAVKGEIYITQDLYLRRIVREARNKTLKDLLPRVGDETDIDFRSINTSNLYQDGWGSNEDGEQELRLLFENKSILDYPKPKKLIAKLIASVRAESGIVMDFFSGAATTANSIFDLNSTVHSNLTFIMVQLPEPCDEISEAFKAGYKTICDIGKERIRRAAKKIKEETGADIDYGFRVYRLDESNMRDVYYKPQDYSQDNLDLFADNVKPDRTADDLLSQIMLDWGLPLSLKIEQVKISGKQVFKVAGDSLFACFDTDIDEAFAKEIAKEKPLRIVFRDSGFKNDTAKTNVKQLLKQLSPETEMKVI
jgi:adenine-specific DNA-methyltransferase